MSYFKDFLVSDGQSTDVTQISQHEIRAFILHLQQKRCFSNHRFNHVQDRGLSGHTINCYLRNLRIFFSWLVSEGIIQDNPFDRVKIPRPPRKLIPTFTDSQIQELLSAIDTRSPEGYRDHTIILTLLDTGIYDKGLLDEVYLLPYPIDSGGLWRRLKDITQKTRIDGLMPLLDLELLNMPGLEPSLKEMGINLLLPPASGIKTHFKINLAEFCLKNDIKYPRQVAISSPDWIASNVMGLGIPVVVKSIVHESHTAYSVEEALVYFNKIKIRWGLPVLLQEYIPGEEYNTDCLINRERKLIGTVAMRKLVITEKGKAWSGVTVRDEELLNLSKEILDKLSWTGQAELDFVKHRTSGNYYLLEINPRFGSWIYLASNAGQNLPLASIQIAMGERVEPLPPYRSGLMFVRRSLDFTCPIEYLANLTAKGELVLNKEKNKESA